MRAVSVTWSGTALSSRLELVDAALVRLQGRRPPLALAVLLVLGGSIQYKLTLRRANAIAGGLSSGRAFTEICDQSALAPVAEAVETASDVVSEL